MGKNKNKKNNKKAPGSPSKEPKAAATNGDDAPADEVAAAAAGDAPVDVATDKDESPAADADAVTTEEAPAVEESPAVEEAATAAEEAPATVAEEAPKEAEAVNEEAATPKDKEAAPEADGDAGDAKSTILVPCPSIENDDDETFETIVRPGRTLWQRKMTLYREPKSTDETHGTIGSILKDTNGEPDKGAGGASADDETAKDSTGTSKKVALLFVHGSCAASQQYESLVKALGDQLKNGFVAQDFPVAEEEKKEEAAAVVAEVKDEAKKAEEKDDATAEDEKKDEDGSKDEKKEEDTKEEVSAPEVIIPVPDAVSNIDVLQCHLFDALGCGNSRATPFVDRQVVWKDFAAKELVQDLEFVYRSIISALDKDTPLFIISHSYGTSQVVHLLNALRAHADTPPADAAVVAADKDKKEEDKKEDAAEDKTEEGDEKDTKEEIKEDTDTAAAGTDTAESSIDMIKGLVFMGGALKDCPQAPSTVRDGGPRVFAMPLFGLKLMKYKLTNSFVDQAYYKDTAVSAKVDNKEADKGAVAAAAAAAAELQKTRIEFSQKNNMKMCQAFYRQQNYATSEEARSAVVVASEIVAEESKVEEKEVEKKEEATASPEEEGEEKKEDVPAESKDESDATTTEEKAAEEAVPEVVPEPKALFPSLVIHGKHDGLFPLDTVGTHFASSVPSSSLKVIPKASHQAFEEQPRQVAASILQFISEHV